MKDRWLEEGYAPPQLTGKALVNERFKCYCAATVTAVAAVAAAGTAAYSAHQQAKAQKDAAAQAQGALGADPAATYGSKVEIPNRVDNIGTPQGYGQQLFGDFQASIPSITSAASQINAYALRQRDRVSGGTFRDNLEQQGSNIQSFLSGEIPQDVQGFINRYVAERSGGAFDPSVPGGYGGGLSQSGSGLARSLGLTSLDIMDKGMSYAPTWEQLVDQFTYKPTNALADAGTFLNAAQLQLARDNATYDAAVTKATGDAAPNPQVAGAVNDNLRLDTLKSTASANEMKALSGLITAGVGGLTNIYNSLGTGSTPKYPYAGTSTVPGTNTTAYIPYQMSSMPGGGYATIPKVVA